MSLSVSTAPRTPALLLAGASLLIATACDDDITGNLAFEAAASFSISVERTTQTRFRLEGINGSIAVVGVTDSDSIRVTGMRIVRANSQEEADDHLPDLQIQLDERTDAIVIRTIQPESTAGRSYQVEYDVTVPRDLEVIIESANGRIDVASVRSDLSVENANGDVTLTGIIGDVSVVLGNGQVECECTLRLDGTIGIEVGNGTITLAIPRNSSAQLSATVGNGEVTLSNLVLENASISTRIVTGRLGAGQGTISLIMGNGTINVVGS